jgi:hypothetical protein
VNFARLSAAAAAVLASSVLCIEPVCALPIPMHTPTTAPYTSTVGAHARFSKARINLGSPNLSLAVAFVAAGGGAAFDGQKLIGTLTGNGPQTQAELSGLTKRFGADNITSFTKTANFFVTDALAQLAAGGIALPSTPVPDPSDAKALVAALYAAGAPPRGGFDTEYMLDTLFSHVIHIAVMNEIDANAGLGPKADANFHVVLGQLVRDLNGTDHR